MNGRSPQDIIIARFSWAAIAYAAGVVAFLAATPALIYLEHALGGPPPPPRGEILAAMTAFAAAGLALALSPFFARAILGKPALYVRDGRLISVSAKRQSYAVADIELVRLGPSGVFVNAPRQITITLKNGERQVLEMFLASRLGPELLEGFADAGIACAPWDPDEPASAHDSPPAAR